MKVGVSLVLSALFAQAVCAEVCPASSARQAEDLTVNAGETCEISNSKDVKDKVSNSGTIIFTTSGSGLKFSGTSGSIITIDTDNIHRGAIKVKGDTTIEASSTNGNDLSIEGQDIEIDQGRSLSLKSTKITFGGDSNKGVTISSSAYPSSKNVNLDTTTDITLKDLSLTNIRMSGASLTTITNTKLTLNNSSITSDTDLTIKSLASTPSVSLNTSDSSTFSVAKGTTNTISGKSIKIKNDSNGVVHTFEGEGILDFQATDQIELGASNQTTTLKQGGSNGQTTVGFIADSKLLATKLEVDGIKMQVVKNGEATLSNIETTFKGATLQALNRDNENQVLVIENGNTNNQMGTATIEVSGENTTTTFMGSGIKLYGQAITIKSNASSSSTLLLKTIDDSGEITLGKTSQDSIGQDAKISIQGNSGDSSGSSKSGVEQILQLRGSQTIIGGEVTLKDLSVQTHAKSEGMVFNIQDKGKLILGGVSLVSGIKDNTQKYQSLIFASDTQGKVDIGHSPQPITTPSTDQSVSFKASDFSFTNQEINLYDTGSTTELSLYAMGETSLDSNLGEGIGRFSFNNTTIKNNANTKLAFYSKDGAKISAQHLTLDNVTLETYAFDSVKQNTKNAIDLSGREDDITIKNTVTIDTKKFLYGNTQGIGADITIVGNGNGSGGLTLKAEEASDSFTFGGTVTLDNSSSGGNTSLLKIELGSNGVQTLTENTNVDLIFNGGLTAIGKIDSAQSNSPTTTTLSAKSFTFGEGVSVSSINGTLSFTSSSGDIDITKGKVILEGVANAEASISKTNGGALKLGDVFANGKTKIVDATFVDSNIKVSKLAEDANTLSIKSDTDISGIASIELEDTNLYAVTKSYEAQPLVIESTTTQNLKLNDGAIITSRGISSIATSSISTSNKSFNLNIEHGTFTLYETGDSADSLNTLTLGIQGKQGGNFVFKNTSSNYHDFEAPNIISYRDSTITASAYSFDTKGLNLSSTGGELKLIASNQASNAKSTDLLIKYGEINLNDGGLSYYQGSASPSLAKLKLGLGNEAVKINSKGTSFIEANELDLNGNAITSSGGFLTLKGLSDNSVLGNVVLGDHGGISAVKKQSENYEQTGIKIGNSGTLTLQANAPFTSSSSLLGGGKFGVLQAKTLEFTSSGGVENPLVKIEILQKPIEGEELFTLREGKQIVVQTTEGIFKEVSQTQLLQDSKKSITLDDIFLAPTGYESLELSAQLLNDKQAEITTGTAHSIQVTLKALQGTAWEKSESISDPTAQSQMQALIKTGRNEEILDSILLSNNALKAGFSELISKGDVVTVGNSVNYINDTYSSLAESVIFNDRIQTQLLEIQTSAIANRLARGKNPYKAQEELAKFIHSYHNRAYASNDEDLPAEESISTHKGELWASYDGSMATGNGANSLINGVMVGYDYDVSENFLIGALLQYGYASFDGGFTHTTSHNVALGIYSRVYSGGNEVDIYALQNFGFNTSNIQVGVTTMPKQLNGSMEYDLYRTTLGLNYGYRFEVGSEEDIYYLKPLIGVEFAYHYQEEGVSNSLVPFSVSAMHAYKVGANIGLEMRKYFALGNYIYVIPMVMRDLISSGSDAKVGFVDTQKMTYSPSYASDTSIALQAGGEGKVGENLLVNGSIGVRWGIEKTELLTNWSVGLKYKF